MPHVIIEYTADLEDEIGALVADLPNIALGSGFFPDSNAFKVRAYCANHSHMGSAKQSALFVTIRLLTGRSDDDKRQISTHLMTELTTRLPLTGTITVEAKDLDAVSYVKRIL